ncbi:MAG: AAA family ATPase [Alphaproteobacteria bacterium]|nr:AAA family ATPase [Alphaproteobacteria bacterium]
MYEDFYGLKEKPFSIQPDADFLYWSRMHTLAFAMLQYGVLNRAGFTVITGGIGCGKTTLVRHLLNKLGDDVTVGLLSNTPDDNANLLEWISMAFGLYWDEKSDAVLYDQFRQFLILQYSRGRRTLLIIDEAQNLGPRALENLRMLSNINADKDQLLQLIMVGQPQLRDLLRQPNLIQIAQRVSSDFHLRPLGRDEVTNYIGHRLKVAGGGDRSYFTLEACHEIFKSSQGVPRVVNILCDTALIYGFSQSMPQITGEIVEQVIRDKSEYGVFDYSSDTGANFKVVGQNTSAIRDD